MKLTSPEKSQECYEAGIRIEVTARLCGRFNAV